MLQLRPSCEHCDKPLPPDSGEAMICSYECTFCHDCVMGVLHNVCPNCGGGFESRPVRPARAWREGISLAEAPASNERVHQPVDTATHEGFCRDIESIPPELR